MDKFQTKTVQPIERASNRASALKFDFINQQTQLQPVASSNGETLSLPATHLNGCVCSTCCDQADFSSDGSTFESDFNTFGIKWAQPNGKGTPINITYSYTNLLDGGLKGDLSNGQIKSAIEEAFEIWSQYAPLKFVEVKDTGTKSKSNPDAADIRLGHTNLGGRGGTLGRANLKSFSGDLATTVNFDNQDTWSTQSSGFTFDFLEVAVHEIGHALGLTHESGQAAIMNPSIKNRYSGLGSAFLLQDDINGIRSLYGQGKGSVKPLSGKSAPSPAPQPKSAPAPAPTPAPAPAPTPTPKSDSPQASTNKTDRFDQRVLELVNKERTKRGLDALKLNGKLDQVADKHAENMAEQDFFGHTGKNGSSPAERVAKTGYNAKLVKQNIAGFQNTPEWFVRDLMSNAKTRGRLLDSEVTEMGLGYAEMPNDPGSVKYGRYWTQVLAAKQDAKPSPAPNRNPNPEPSPTSPSQPPRSNANTITGTAGNDQLIGNAKNQTLKGFAGKDTIKAGAGRDTVYGGNDKDIIFGGEGNDQLLGENGNDTINGGKGADLIKGGNGSDRLHGNEGNDKLYGGAGKDILHGGAGKDILHGGAGKDILHGGAGKDILHGGAGKDILKGGKDGDRLFGNTAADQLFGEAGNDTLHGGKGSDTLTGGTGNDTLIGTSTTLSQPGAGERDVLRGGAGKDTFVLGNTRRAFYLASGNSAQGKTDLALITDFKLGQDKIQLHGSAKEYELVRLGSQTQIFHKETGSAQTDLIASVRGDFAGLSLLKGEFDYV
ncbi:MAG: matrixin family metalloprotease [Cyanothece sp. SIO1E1]|nr:matrixin family metalloprotease [Cyanothece sp. SIO1E1]